MNQGCQIGTGGSVCRRPFTAGSCQMCAPLSILPMKSGHDTSDIVEVAQEPFGGWCTAQGIAML